MAEFDAEAFTRSRFKQAVADGAPVDWTVEAVRAAHAAGLAEGLRRAAEIEKFAAILRANPLPWSMWLIGRGGHKGGENAESAQLFTCTLLDATNKIMAESGGWKGILETMLSELNATVASLSTPADGGSDD